MSRRRPSKKKSSTKKFILLFLLLCALTLIFCAAAYTLYLDSTVRARFEGKRFALPAKVYARPLELYPGLKLRPSELTAELALLGYRQTPDPVEPGSYRWDDQAIDLVTRPFVFGDGPQKDVSLRIEFRSGIVERLVNRESEEPLHLVRLDPALIGGIYPGDNEDRVLVRLDEIPRHVVDALIAVEDRRFYSHRGIDPRGIARAAYATARGGAVQGGSTVTQQLIKNFYLSADRTLSRKFNEMVMAVLLEIRYSKEEILETYFNEVYLAQDGNRAIHGFGLASSYFFDKHVGHLTVPEAALLVGMLKGPSYYSPRRHPQRALGRRNLVLAQMHEVGFITDEELRSARATPLGVLERPPRGTSPYPAFLNLVHRQLRRDYRDKDLRSEGLQIFTTLDPQVQRAAESALSNRLTQLERGRNIKEGTLQGALVVTSTQNAEVQAVVGGRNPRLEGFNRALDAQRPVGSLIKPVVYLTALQQSHKYTLATLLDDTPLVLKQAGTDDWEPQNYDKEFHGQVPLRIALMNSYNVSAARLGMEVGIPQIMANVRLLGIDRDLPQYASSVLGVNALSPLEVTQIYQTLASGGFRTPLQAIREVLTAQGEPLQSYPLKVEQVVDPAPLHLLTVAMQDVVRRGTARGLSAYLPTTTDVAGKTGTTNDFRDSWFAGFTGDHVAVVWVGRDDNQPAGLTGSSGAMTVWGEMMAALAPQPLIVPYPENIEYAWIDPATGLLSADWCQDAVQLPFIKGSAPTEAAPCGPRPVGRSIRGWFKRIFE